MRRVRTQEVSIPSLAILLAVAVVPPLVKGYPVLAQSPAVDLSVSTADPQGTTVKIAGSSSLGTINQVLKQRFEQQFPGTKVELADGKTDAALQSLLDGRADLVAIGRTLTAEETAKGLVFAPLTRNKIAIIVGASNPFKQSLTLDQFAKIFRGEITDWSKLGRSAGPIRLIDRPHTSNTRQAFQNYPVFQNAPFRTGPNAVKLSEDNTEAIVKGLGTNGISYAIADQVMGKSGIHVVAMHNALPTNAKYPFSQPLAYVYKGPEPSPGVKAFLDYAIAPQNQQAVEQARVAAATAALPSEPTSPIIGSSDTTVESPPANLDTVSTPGSWWLWWLSIPLLGGLLWWLLKRRGAETRAAPAAVAGVAEGRLILVPYNCRDAYAYWEVSETTHAAYRRQGGEKLVVRLYDVTDIDLDRQNAHSIQDFVSDGRSPDLHIPIQVDNRDYLAELGYVTRDHRWLPIARSESVRVPACAPAGNDPHPGGGATTHPFSVDRGGEALQAGGAALAAVGATTMGKALAQDRAGDDDLAPEVGRIILVPRNAEAAYAYWEVSESAKETLRRQGGEKLVLNLYDVTDGVDLERQPALRIQQFDVDEQAQDRHLPIAVQDRDYLVELGYVAAGDRWLNLVRSQPVHMPSQFEPAFPNESPNG
ncbi:MAG: extracellular solute-binding protein [Kovacikia sp.]